MFTQAISTRALCLYSSREAWDLIDTRIPPSVLSFFEWAGETRDLFCVSPMINICGCSWCVFLWRSGGEFNW